MKKDIQDFGCNNPKKFTNSGNGFRNNQNQHQNIQDHFQGLKKQNFILDRQLLKNHERKQTLFKFGKYELYFPYENMHDSQKQYIKQVFNTLDNSKNLLIQSPTGTGKTLCLLLSTMVWVQKKYEETKQKIKIIYTSRSHSQLQQIQKQLKKSPYRPNMAIFGSRQKLCLTTPILQQGKKVQDMSYENWCSHCNVAVRQKLGYIKKMKQHFYYDTNIQFSKETITNIKIQQKYRKKISLQYDHDEQMKTSKLNMLDQIFESTKKRCSYYNEYDYYQKQGPIFNSLKHQILTLSKMKKQGQQQNFCPYYYPKRVKTQATLFLMPYNYLLDDKILQYSQSLIEDSIIIFDEGHNIIKTACQGSSFRFDRHVIDEAYYSSQISEEGQQKIDADEYQRQSQKNRQDKKSAIINQINHQSSPYTHDSSKDKEMRNILLNMRGNFQTFFNQSESFQFQNNLLDKSQKLYHTANPKIIQQIVSEMFFRQRLDICKQFLNVKQILQFIILYANQMVQIRKVHKLSYFKLQVFAKNCQKIYNILTKDYLQQKYFILLKKKYIKSQTGNLTIRGQCYLQCLTPQYLFKKITELKPNSMIITSGTLSPMEVWQKQLKIPLIPFTNSHMISQKNVKAKVISKYQTTLKMNDTQNQEYLIQQSLQVIQKILQKTPNGVLVIVPSFAYLKKIKEIFQLEQLKNVKIRQAFLKLKQTILFQGKKDFEETMKLFSDAAVQQTGALLFCVCRGKMSQGIDFTDKLCRAVVFIGIPYAYLMDPFIQQKKIFLKKFPIGYSKFKKNQPKKKYKYMTGQQWYKFQAARAVNQSLGRVVRHQFDYGMIYLLDSRFCGGSKFDFDMEVRNNISSWISQYMREDQSLQDILLEAQKFYLQKNKQCLKVMNTQTLEIQNAGQESKQITKIGSQP